MLIVIFIIYILVVISESILGLMVDPCMRLLSHVGKNWWQNYSTIISKGQLMAPVGHTSSHSVHQRLHIPHFSL